MTPEQRKLIAEVINPEPWGRVDEAGMTSAHREAIAVCLAEQEALLMACRDLLSYLDGKPPEAPPYGSMVRARLAIRDAEGEDE